MVAVSGEGNITTVFQQQNSPVSTSDPHSPEPWVIAQQINEKGEENSEMSTPALLG